LINKSNIFGMMIAEFSLRTFAPALSHHRNTAPISQLKFWRLESHAFP
jgi:hypothetical protein